MLRSAAAMPAIERRSGPRASAAPPRSAARGSGASSSTWIAFIGSTYGLRSAIERCSTGWRSSSSRRLDDLEHGLARCARARPRSAPRAGRSGDELEVLARRSQARLRERHLEVLDERAEERPARGRAARSSAIVARPRSAVPQPYHAGQQAAVLRPREDPRDRAQRPQVVAAAGPRGRARADLEQRQLVDRREGAEERREAGVLPDERAVGRLGERPTSPSRSPRARPSGGSVRATLGERREQRRGERRLEVAVREPGQAVLERDRLALLGQLEPAGRVPGRLREDRGVRRPAAAARRCRRGRGRSSARRRARAASAASASCAR